MSPNFKLLKKFIKFNLGCQCPDEVFDSIQKEHNISIEQNIIVDNIFTIGNKLLIYILKINNVDITKNVICFFANNDRMN